MDVITVQVYPGNELPAPGGTLLSRSMITESVYEVEVTKILTLRWHRDNSLLVTVEGRKKEVANGPEADRTTK
jgi:hypothetical protein